MNICVGHVMKNWKEGQMLCISLLNLKAAAEVETVTHFGRTRNSLLIALAYCPFALITLH